MSSAVAIDFETFYASKKLKYSLKGSIAEQYCRHHLFDPYMVSVSDGTTCWAGHPRDFNWSSLNGRTLLSHNSYFDSTVLHEMERRGMIPRVDHGPWLCTANMTSYLCNRRSLADSVEHLFKIKVSKEARSDADGKHWPDDFSPEERTRMLQYARMDATYCWSLFDKFGDQWPEWERKLSDLTIRQGQRGIAINRALLDDYILITFDALRATEKLIPWLAEADDDSWDDFNAKPTSTKCIAEQCRRSGIPCPPVKSEDEEAYLEWEATYLPDHLWIGCLSAWRTLNRLHKTFKMMHDRLRADDTMPFGLKYFGAHTGRWAGDAGINLQNPRKKPVLINEHGLMETDEARIDAALRHRDHPMEGGLWPYWVKHAIDFRALLVPRPGHRMIVSDLAQIEPRVLAWLTGNKPFLAMVATGMSVYEAFARVSMGWTGGNLKKESPDLYQLAKINVLGLGYGAGWEKFITMAAGYGINLTEGDPEFVEETNPFTGATERHSGHGQRARKIVADFRASNKRITDLWDTLDSKLRGSVGGDFSMRLPSGRRMVYAGVHCDQRIEPHPVTKQPRRKYVYTADTDGRRRQYYGGMLTENITQAVARDVFGTHLLALDQPGRIDVLFTCHDEAVVETPLDSGVTARDIERMMSFTPDWLPGCPIAAEAKEVAYYQK